MVLLQDLLEVEEDSWDSLHVRSTDDQLTPQLFT